MVVVCGADRILRAGCGGGVMKLIYSGYDGKQYTAEWVSSPLGHLRICKVGSNRAIMQPFMGQAEAKAWFRNILSDPDAGAKVVK